MTTCTLTAAAEALNILLAASKPAPIVERPRRKKPTITPVSQLHLLDLDPAAKAQREAEQKRKVEEVVKVLRRSAKVKKEEMETRERVGFSGAVGLEDVADGDRFWPCGKTRTGPRKEQRGRLWRRTTMIASDFLRGALHTCAGVTCVMRGSYIHGSPVMAGRAA